MTAHNTAKKEDIAKIVIMPGDPLRTKWIAKTFLTNYHEVNKVRGMLAYTGEYKNHRLTIMGHGMGIPSIGIYSHELFSPNIYDVDAIIRIGSAGSWDKKIDLGNVIIADQAISFSTYGEFIGLGKQDTYTATPKMLEIATEVSKKLNINALIGKVYTSDVFYGDSSMRESLIKKTRALASEMEIYGLYANAKKNKKDALGIITISDNPFSKEEMSPKLRETGFNKMVELALETAIKYLENK